MLRQSALLAILGVALLSAAFAQDAGVESGAGAVFDPAFESRPLESSRPYFPRRALARGASGVVHLCCEAREDRSLDCRVAFETPERLGFGAASLSIAEGFRLTPESSADLQSRPTRAFRIPFRWQITPVPAALDEAIQRIDNDTENLCGAGTGRALPADYIVIEGSRMRRR